MATSFFYIYVMATSFFYIYKLTERPVVLLNAIFTVWKNILFSSPTSYIQLIGTKSSWNVVPTVIQKSPIVTMKTLRVETRIITITLTCSQREQAVIFPVDHALELCRQSIFFLILNFQICTITKHVKRPQAHYGGFQAVDCYNLFFIDYENVM